MQNSVNFTNVLDEEAAKKRRKQKNTRDTIIAVSVGLILLCGLNIFGQNYLQDAKPTPTRINPTVIAAKIMTEISEKLSKGESTIISPTAEEFQGLTRPTQPPTAMSAPGTTRDNPFPVGMLTDIDSQLKMGIRSVTFTVDSAVAGANMFNDTPVPGEEYIRVQVYLQCEKSSNETCSFTSRYLKIVGSDGIIRSLASVVSPGDEYEDGDFFGGAVKEGSLYYLVTKGDPNLVLFYEPLFSNDRVFFAIK